MDVQRDDEVDMGVEIPVQLVTPPASSSSSRDPLRPATTGDVVGSYEEYQFRKQAAWSTDPIYENFRFNKKVNYHVGGQTQSGYQVNVQASVKGEERKEPPPRTTTYKVPNPEPEPEPEKIEIFQIPCFNDYLVMFSSAAGNIYMYIQYIPPFDILLEYLLKSIFNIYVASTLGLYIIYIII